MLEQKVELVYEISEDGMQLKNEITYLCPHCYFRLYVNREENNYDRR